MKHLSQVTLALGTIVLLGLGAVEASASPAGVRLADATTPAAPVEDPAVTKLATSLVAQAQSGNVDRKLLDPKMNAALTPDVLAAVTKQLAPLGPPKSVTFADESSSNGIKVYRYHVAWDSVTVDELVALDTDGKVAGWLFRPSTQPPAANPAPASSPRPNVV